MSQFLFFILLLIMMLPALVSVALASRHWISVIWNGLWYVILGEVAVKAFDSPNGKYVGLTFLALYLYRIVTRKKSSVRFQFHQMRQQGPRRPSAWDASQRLRPRTRPSTSERVVSEAQVIEGEYKRVDPDSNAH